MRHRAGHGQVRRRAGAAYLTAGRSHRRYDRVVAAVWDRERRHPRRNAGRTSAAARRRRPDRRSGRAGRRAPPSRRPDDPRRAGRPARHAGRAAGRTFVHCGDRAAPQRRDHDREVDEADMGCRVQPRGRPERILDRRDGSRQALPRAARGGDARGRRGCQRERHRRRSTVRRPRQSRRAARSSPRCGRRCCRIEGAADSWRATR